MAYIVNGSIISASEFEAIKKHETDKLNKEFLPWEILFVTVISFAVIFLISYGIYDVIHNGYTPACACH